MSDLREYRVAEGLRELADGREALIEHLERELRKKNEVIMDQELKIKELGDHIKGLNMQIGRLRKSSGPAE